MSSDNSSTIVTWLTPCTNRPKLLTALGVALLAVATIGALTTPAEPRLTVDEGRPQNNTLIALQGYQQEGKIIEITPGGEVVWEYAKPDDVFDVEMLGDGRVQAATADEIPDSDCPERYRNDGYENCVRNSLRIIDKESKETLWEYAWFDAKLRAHELHDVDRYTFDGETRWVFVDMGNDRVFAVNRSKEVVWQWNATDRYNRPEGMGPEGDWTHMNDIDRVGPNTFRVSLRNFDTVIDLHIERGRNNKNRSIHADRVVGPDYFDERGDVLYEQHNPDTLNNGTLLVADSENDRIVEVNTTTDRVVWEYGGSATFNWPRDADRLNNGHTLITDSYNDRIVELDEDGEVIWAVETGALPYEADRLPGEGSIGPTARDVGTPNRTNEASIVRERATWLVSMAKYVGPDALAEQLFLLVTGLLALVGAGIEYWREA